MGAANGKPRPTVRSAIEVADQSDEDIDVIDLEYSDYFDDVFEENKPVQQNGSLRKLRLWDFPYSSPTKNGKRAASENCGMPFTRRGLYSESDVSSPPKPDYGTILNHGRKRIQSAKEVRNNSKRSSLLRKLFTKPEKRSDPDSDVYQANAFHRLRIPSSSAMGTCCSSPKSPSSYSKQQTENFSRTFPHKREFEKVSPKREFEEVSPKREFERASHKREFEGVTRKPTRPQDKNFENDKNRSNVARRGEDVKIGQNSTDIWVGRETPKKDRGRPTHDLMITDDQLSSEDNRPKPYPRTIVVNNGTGERDTASARKPYMHQPHVHRHRKLTPAVPLTIPVFKAQLQNTLPPVGDVEELEFERGSEKSKSSNSTPTKVISRPPAIQYHYISSSCSSSWPSLSNGDDNHPHIPPSTPPHRRILSPSPKHLQSTARQNHDMLPKRKLVRKLTPIILEVPKNLEGRNHSLSDEEDETNEFLQNGAYGYESMVEGTPKSNGYGLSDEYREELKNTVDELIDQLSPTIMGDEYVGRPYGRSPSYWRRQPSPATNFVFPDVRRVNDDGKVETTFSSVNRLNGDASSSMTSLNNKVHRRKITPAPSAQPPLYRLDPEKMAFSSSAFAEDEERL